MMDTSHGRVNHSQEFTNYKQYVVTILIQNISEETLLHIQNIEANSGFGHSFV